MKEKGGDRFRLGNEVLVACGGLDLPPKKVEKKIIAKHQGKVIEANFAFAPVAVAA